MLLVRLFDSMKKEPLWRCQGERRAWFKSFVFAELRFARRPASLTRSRLSGSFRYRVLPRVFCTLVKVALTESSTKCRYFHSADTSVGGRAVKAGNVGHGNSDVRKAAFRRVI